MAFCEEISKTVIKSGVLPPTYKMTLIGGYGAYFENVLSIVDVTPSKITVLLKKGKLFVCGDRLKISKYCGGDLAVSGEITCVGVEK